MSFWAAVLVSCWVPLTGISLYAWHGIVSDARRRQRRAVVVPIWRTAMNRHPAGKAR